MPRRRLLSGEFVWGVVIQEKFLCVLAYPLRLCVKPSFSRKDAKFSAKPQRSSRHKRWHVDVVLPDLAVKAGAVDSQEICRRLLVPPSSLQRPFYHQTLDIFKSHVGWHVPGDIRRCPFRKRPVVERQVDGLDLFVF